MDTPMSERYATFDSTGCGPYDAIGKTLADFSRHRAASGQLKDPIIAVSPPRGLSLPQAHSVSSWAWEQCEGQKTTVEVYGCGSFAQLYLNSKKLGTKFFLGRCHVRFRARYQTGTLTAILFDWKHRETGRSILQSADNDTLLYLEPESNTAAGGELFYVRMRLADRKGVTKILQQGQICLSVEGGKLEGLGHCRFFRKAACSQASVETFYGEAFALVRAGREGSVCLTASWKDATASAQVSVTPQTLRGAFAWL